MPNSPEQEANPLQTRHSTPFPSCKSECTPGDNSLPGDVQLDASSRGWNDGAQTVAIEHLMMLKQGLRTTDTELFWKRLMEDITSIGKAQYGFVARRVHGGEPIPELGGRRPSLFGAVFYYNDGYQAVGLQRNRYFAGGNPLLHMDHQQPCLIPENLKSLVSFGDDQLPFAAEAYLAVPSWEMPGASGADVDHRRPAHSQSFLVLLGNDPAFAGGLDCPATSVGGSTIGSPEF